MLLNDFNVFTMDRSLVTVSPDVSNVNNNNNNNFGGNVGLFYNQNYNGHYLNNNNLNNCNSNANVNSTNNCSIEDGFTFDDKLIDFDQDLDTLSLSLWQSEGFNGIGCEEPMKIEDIFQSDIADFTGGPTLAELNLVDDKLDSTDLDEYLANPPPTTTSTRDDVNTIGVVKPEPSPDDSKKTNTLESLNVFNNVNVPSNAIPLSADEVDQLVMLPAQPNVDPQIYDPPSNNNTPQPSPPPRHFLRVKRVLSPKSTEKQSSNPFTTSQDIIQQLEQVDIKPFIEDSKMPTATTSKDIFMGNNQNMASISPFPVLAIKQEPVSPQMDTSNFVLKYDNERIVESEGKSTDNEFRNSQTVYQPGPSPEYSTSRLRRRNNSNSTECSFSSHDEGFASQPEDNSDQENEDSDDESFYKDYDPKDLIGATTSEDCENRWALDMGRSRKTGQQRYFWQYNVQSKGPKGTRIVSLQDICNDPHVLMEAKDPVFSPDCSMEGVKHAGKARRGDGNDLTPNPKKLLMIGLELKKLSKIINELTPVAQVPVNVRNKSRKEKNKLASRACRLKKKAQHEANKIKLYGLQQEHKRMMNALNDIQHLANVVLEKGRSVHDGRLTDIFEDIVSAKGPKVKVAGNTADFVNTILDNVSAGISDGGLDKI